MRMAYAHLVRGLPTSEPALVQFCFASNSQDAPTRGIIFVNVSLLRFTNVRAETYTIEIVISDRSGSGPTK